MNPPKPNSAQGRCPATRSSARLFLVLASATYLGCVDSTGPPHPLIEETEFAAALDVELGQMTRIGGGVYVEDLTEGDGPELTFGQRVVITYDLHLPDGRHVLRRDAASFKMGCKAVVPGLETGVTGMRVGGTRRIVVPPRTGYGERAPWPLEVPPHSILVYGVEALASSRYERCQGAA